MFLNILSKHIRFYHAGVPQKGFGKFRARVASDRESHNKRRRETNTVKAIDSSIRKSQPFPYAVTEENKTEILNKIVRPLIGEPYEEQLNIKQGECRYFLRTLADRLYREGTPIRMDVTRMPCRLDPVVPSPDKLSYFRSIKLSIWRGPDGKTETVGFLAFPIRTYGDTVAIEINGLAGTPNEIIQISDSLQKFIRSEAKLPVCRDWNSIGGWKNFNIRTNEASDIMLVASMNVGMLKTAEIEDEVERFKEFMVRESLISQLKLRSLYVKFCTSSRNSTSELVDGEKTITETIGSYQFDIGPETKFHANIPAVQSSRTAIKGIIKELFSERPNFKPIIIETSCADGLNAALLSDTYSKYIGIAATEQDCEGATVHVKQNSLKEAQIVHGDNEAIIRRILEKNGNPQEDFLVIVSSSHTDHALMNSVKVIRNSTRINKAIIIVKHIGSRTGTERQLLALKQFCQRRDATQAFVPVRATPIDLTPDTPHCDMIMLFERMKVI